MLNKNGGHLSPFWTTLHVRTEKCSEVHQASPFSSKMKVLNREFRCLSENDMTPSPSSACLNLRPPSELGSNFTARSKTALCHFSLPDGPIVLRRGQNDPKKGQKGSFWGHIWDPLLDPSWALPVLEQERFGQYLKKGSKKGVKMDRKRGHFGVPF